MSGFLGQILGSVLGGQQAGQGSPLAGILQEVLQSKGGGLASIVSQFEAAGLGDVVRSWVGTGANVPVSGEQIGRVFSNEQLQNWAAQAGTTPEALSGLLAQALPHVVDHATPGGTIPAPAVAPDLNAILGKLLGGMTR